MRVVHNWTLLRLTIYLASLYQDHEPTLKDFVKGRGQDRDRDLDFGVVVAGLMREVLGNVGRSHGEESVFARVVRRKAEELGWDMRGGLGSGGLGMEKVEGEWRKLRKVAEEAVGEWEWVVEA